MGVVWGVEKRISVGLRVVRGVEKRISVGLGVVRGVEKRISVGLRVLCGETWHGGFAVPSSSGVR